MIAPAQFVRTIARGETLADVIEESKARAWVDDVEYAVLKLVAGDRLLVRGGRTGIEFLTDANESKVFMVRGGQKAEVERIYFHTHPRVTGPSDEDLRMLRILGQTRSYLFEIGGDANGTLIRPKGGADAG